MRVLERYMRGKIRAGAQILPEANVKGTFRILPLRAFAVISNIYVALSRNML